MTGTWFLKHWLQWPDSLCQLWLIEQKGRKTLERTGNSDSCIRKGDGFTLSLFSIKKKRRLDFSTPSLLYLNPWGGSTTILLYPFFHKFAIKITYKNIFCFLSYFDWNFKTQEETKHDLDVISETLIALTGLPLSTLSQLLLITSGAWRYPDR